MLDFSSIKRISELQEIKNYIGQLYDYVSNTDVTLHGYYLKG